MIILSFSHVFRLFLDALILPMHQAMTDGPA